MYRRSERNYLTSSKPVVPGIHERVVSMLDSGAVGHGFKSQPRRCRVTVSGKLFTLIVPLFTMGSEIGCSPLRGCEGNFRPGGK